MGDTVKNIRQFSAKVPLEDAVTQIGAMDSPRVTKSRIDALFRDHNEALVRFLRNRLRSDSEAEEAAQEAYVRLLQLDESEQPSFMRAYLFKVAANVATDILRRNATRLRGLSQVDASSIQLPVQEISCEARQQLTIVSNALDELPPRCREAFRLSRDGGSSTTEIAKLLDVSDRMVRLYLERALEHIQYRLQSFEGAGS